MQYIDHQMSRKNAHPRDNRKHDHSHHNDHQDLNLLKEEILEIVNANKYGELILKRYLPIEALLEEANIRRDYAAALSKVRRGSDLSPKLEWSFGAEDLQKLAILHQKNKYRVKIEDLLTDCNFHYECSKFTSHDYEEVLQTEVN